MATHVLNSLGWLWRQNGVELAITLDGREIRVFVPMGRVHLAFDSELRTAGHHEPASVSGPSVGSIFGAISHAFKSIGHAATHNAVFRAASNITRTAGKWAQKGLGAISNNPFYGFVQSGVSFVPGIGTGISSGMGAASAIGRGESLKNIGIAAARGALPGGPLAGAAFDAAIGIANGRRLDKLAIDVARNQIPGGRAARAAFDAGLNVVRTRSLNGLPGAAANFAQREATSYAGRFVPHMPQAPQFARSFMPHAPQFARSFAPQLQRYAPQLPHPQAPQFARFFGQPKMARALQRSSLFGRAFRGFGAF